ncbi:putative PEP-CTERM sorting domain-containing protein [Rubrivivax sp. A210]|uniref:FxDxF family PEP-CTERM protein n=1 Tax=Rubrivivax sp. A210 TaxID=2772301 RepID=UPI001917C81F|nr:FxDxF family PEP-CTERM protein [Rubrivivax sp. A210]CAD5372002.1 putative PEP-CTERM sorting domain-containing protein [Rubrivivax sp. A210]
MKLKILCAAGLLSAAVAASASSISYNFTLPVAPSTPFSERVLVSGTSFLDDWHFIAPLQPATATGSAISVDIRNFWNIDNISISLHDSLNQVLLAGLTGERSTVVNVPLVAGSSYHFQIRGNVLGPSGGSYSFVAGASPVPEPGAFALVMAGLGAALLVRRRKG